MSVAVKNESNLKSGKMIILAAIVPCMIYYLIFYHGAMFYAFYLSFTNWQLGVDTKFIKLDNFVRIFTADNLFFKSLFNTLYYTVFTVPVGTILAIFVASLINGQGKKLASAFRTIYFIPVVTSLVAVAVVWKWLYQPSFGLINQVLGIFGFRKVMWLSSPSVAMLSVMIMSIWRDLGFKAVIIMAALQGIPRTYFEAAMIDGAQKVQIFLKITIPLIFPAITFIAVTGMISAMQVFTEMHVMMSSNHMSIGASGPLDSTRTVVVHLYERAFSRYRMGYASATAILLFIIILAMSLIQLRIMEKRTRI